MAAAADIAATWRSPRGMMRTRLAQGIGEDRALAILIGALLVIFISQTPPVARAAYADGGVALAPRLLALFLGVLALIPVLYLLAGASHLVARLAGGHGTWRSARVALFGSLLAVAPVMLLQGLVAGLIGPGAALSSVGVVVLTGFVLIWALSLAEAEFPRHPTEKGS